MENYLHIIVYHKKINLSNHGGKEMENYLMLKGKKIELTEQQIEEIKSCFNLGNVKLSEISVGNTFKIGDYEFVVLEQSGDTTAVILKSLLHEGERFGDNNNFNGSNADKLCAEFAQKILAIIGEDNLVEHTVDLTSDDGLKDYGCIKRKMSLLTCNQYRKYVDILDKYKFKKWWWLVTPYSTPTHDNSSWIKCVSPVGNIYYVYYNFDSGVRPFCIFNSSISVSCEE